MRSTSTQSPPQNFTNMRAVQQSDRWPNGQHTVCNSHTDLGPCSKPPHHHTHAEAQPVQQGCHCCSPYCGNKKKRTLQPFSPGCCCCHLPVLAPARGCRQSGCCLIVPHLTSHSADITSPPPLGVLGMPPRLRPWVAWLHVGAGTSSAWVRTIAATSSTAAWRHSIAAPCAAIAALGNLVSGAMGCVEATAIGAVDLHTGGAKGTGGSRINRLWLLNCPPTRGQGTAGCMRKD